MNANHVAQGNAASHNRLFLNHKYLGDKNIIMQKFKIAFSALLIALGFHTLAVAGEINPGMTDAELAKTKKGYKHLKYINKGRTEETGKLTRKELKTLKKGNGVHDQDGQCGDLNKGEIC